MHIESLAVGDELLRGEIVDANAAYLGAALLRAGLSLSAATVLPDDEEIVAQGLRAAAARADAVIVSGGLGPTIDDRTAAAAARAFGRPLVQHEPSLLRIRALFAARGLALSPNNEKQALVPEGAEVLENPVGTAPAFLVKEGRASFFFLPGVPREYHAIATASVLPRLAARHEGVVVRACTLHTIGAAESRVDQLLRGVALSGVRLSTRVEGPETHLILVAADATAQAADERLERASEAALGALGPLVYGRDGDTLASRLGEELLRRGFTLAVAESCTGGLVSAELTRVPGSSRYFRTGLVAYANETKTQLAGVPAELIAAHGAVSEEVARALARGIRARAHADVGLGITGVAGPGGSSDDKPVGLVHFAASGLREVHRRVIYPPGRDRVRTYAARYALAVALESLSEERP